MKRKILVLTITALILVMTLLGSLPALAQPADPNCGWYLDRYWQRLTGESWYGYWCNWGGDQGWQLYAWYDNATGNYYYV
jgi:hypothetical protein